jgi:uncharacterized membrane protein YkvA (DUF1232 family)
LTSWLLPIAVAVIGLYVLLVLALAIAGRRTQARALAGFVPDCLILLRRLIGDPRIPRSRKFVLLFGVAYLAMPIDLIPDFLPVIGQIDDAIVLALMLRYLLRSGGSELIQEHWPGPATSLDLVLRLAYGRQAVQ